MQSVCLLSLGCKVNQYEIDCILRKLKGSYMVSRELSPADIYIINTCAVTKEAEKKSRQMIARALKYNPKAKIYICGCASQYNPESFLSKKNVVLVTGVAEKGKLAYMLNRHGKHIASIPKTYEDDMLSYPTRARAYIKVQDGCDNFCSYCLIPYLRGRSRSRSLSSIYNEAKLLSPMCKELVLTGINLSDYRVDGKLALDKLLSRLKDIGSRIRISSLEEGVITPEFLKVLSKMKNFCPHFHLSLQSGSDRVLRSMNRKYTTKEFMEKINLIRKFFPDCAITTDVIVGFPTETEKDFNDTLKFIRMAQFSKIHFFRYSPRKGTVAYTFKNLGSDIVRKREDKLKKLSKKMHNDFLKKSLGKTLEVLIEGSKDDMWTGLSREYIRVYLKGNFHEGDIVSIYPQKLFKDGVLGKEKSHTYKVKK